METIRQVGDSISPNPILRPAGKDGCADLCLKMVKRERTTNKRNRNACYPTPFRRHSPCPFSAKAQSPPPPFIVAILPRFCKNLPDHLFRVAHCHPNS
jgi:hypothetical protein